MHHPTMIAALALFVTSAAVEAAPVLATGHDAVTTPGRAVAVSAKFERAGWRFWRPDIQDSPVTFRIAGHTYPARTDRDGVATIQVRPNSAGVVPIEASLDATPGTLARSRLFVLEPTRPVAVVDIDGTISALPDLLVPLLGHKAKTYAGAPELLRDLATTHTIVYLTARDDAFDKKSRVFLARHRFPDGPVLFNDLGLSSKSEAQQLKSKNHAAFKLEVILGLKQDQGLRVALGIGNAETDAEAYERAGLPSYIHTKKTAPGTSFRFREYAELRTKLVADGVLGAGVGVVASIP